MKGTPMLKSPLIHPLLLLHSGLMEGKWLLKGFRGSQGKVLRRSRMKLCELLNFNTKIL